MIEFHVTQLFSSMELISAILIGKIRKEGLSRNISFEEMYKYVIFEIKVFLCFGKVTGGDK